MPGVALQFGAHFPDSGQADARASAHYDWFVNACLLHVFAAPGHYLTLLLLYETSVATLEPIRPVYLQVHVDDIAS
jgi:hypothetical protein